MHIHILGICGTFMAGVAALARESGLRVSGSDAGAWPPMSTQLAELGIEVCGSYAPEHIGDSVDLVVVGNVISRGNPAMEHVLNSGMPYISGPQWLGEQVLAGRQVLAVAGTHGKTTTASLLAWLLEAAGESPGFLIGGVPLNFGVSARLGSGHMFVVEADEYDTAFFDKRSKFVHYHPDTVVLNNLEFDHADIFDDLAAIERQFHHLIRTVPGRGHIVVNAQDQALHRVLERGCWSQQHAFDSDTDWHVSGEPGQQQVYCGAQHIGAFKSPMAGAHNRSNALAAIAAAVVSGADASSVLDGLSSFRNVRRRLEVLGSVGDIRVIDDFAHHPTAVRETVMATREITAGRVLAVLEPRSNTMRMGVHAAQLDAALRLADRAWMYMPEGLSWSVDEDADGGPASLNSVEEIVAVVAAEAMPGDSILVMSNGAFDGIHQKLLSALANRGEHAACAARD